MNLLSLAYLTYDSQQALHTAISVDLTAILGELGGQENEIKTLINYHLKFDTVFFVQWDQSGKVSMRNNL